ncbi:MAG: PEP-CTERM sorting domain-containing protein [Acidobacteria bacterium]|nr:PEP-CTERM sorting domain-containing protein [Acidobacteriota bacterium]
MKMHVLMGLALSPAALSAGIIASSGDVVLETQAAATYIADGFNDNCTVCPIHVWDELKGFAFRSPIVLDSDLADPTKYYGDGSGTSQVQIVSMGGPTVPAFKRINSYYAYQDPISNHTSMGTITFGANEMVLGVLVHDASLAQTDFLRVAAAPYPLNPFFQARGLELGPERLKLSADRRTLFLDLTASSPGDQLRIITMEAIPEPGTVVLVAGALLAALIRRRR